MSASRPFWIRFLPASLTNRVFLLYSVLLVVIVGLGLALFLRQQFQKDVRDSQLAAVMLAEVVAQAVQDSVVIGDYDTVEKTLKKAVLSPMVATADFIDLGGGKVHAENHSADTSPPPAPLVAWVQRQLDSVNRNITVGGKDYGVLRLQFDGPHIASGLWSATVAALQLAFISLLIGLVLIRFALARWLGSLDELRTVLEVLGQGGQQTNVQISPNAPSEIRRVVDMFNQTAVLVREREASRRALDEQNSPSTSMPL
jgi:two-component system, sensor histidine kinase and response regulator